MRIGFDAHAIGRRQTGNETYALGLLHGLSRIGVSVLAYGYDAPPVNGHDWRRMRRSSRWLRIAVDVPLAATRDRLDIYHGSYALPPILPCRSVVTIHDLTFVAHPKWLPRGQATIMRHTVGHAVRRATRIIAVSECTKRDILEFYDIPEEKIAVTHLAPRPGFMGDAHPGESSPRTDESSPRADKSSPRTDESSPYYLYVGNITPRKNVATLVRALDILKRRGAAIPLVVAGQPGAAHDEVSALVRSLGLENLVRFTGYVSDEELRALYLSCTAVVHPALYEGFGLTPLEAMALGRPVLAANAGSLPEVIGDAGILLPPTDADAWADAMERVLSPTLSEGLTVRGLRRAAEFSWERCARETVEVYEAALKM
jgi:glycosyltransferase involved in cell wall biosynthesis